MIENRKKLINIEHGSIYLIIALESLQCCLFVLDTCQRISRQIGNGKYYPALKMIQELQATHLKFIRDYPFSKKIITWLPECQQNIRKAVLKELKDWFIIVKECACKVGKLAMDMTVVRHEKVSALMENDPSLKKRDKKFAMGASMELAISEELEMRK